MKTVPARPIPAPLRHEPFSRHLRRPALESSEMDVRELAPALLAIGDLLDASTRALCGNQVRPRVNVRGSFKTGSFGIDFTLATSLLGRMRDMLSGNEGTALANAVTILTALGIAAPKAERLFAVLKWLRGREILQVQMQDHTAILHVEGDTLEIDLPVLTLLRDVGVRRATEQVLARSRAKASWCLRSAPIRKSSKRSTGARSRGFTRPNRPTRSSSTNIARWRFSIVSLAFKGDDKWRLYDGTSTIHAAITDAGFLSRVHNSQISFSKGDVLVCNVRMQQWQTSDGAKPNTK